MKILESYVLVAPGVHGLEDAKHQLYYAVIDGEVRAKHKGRVLEAEAIHELRTRKHGDEPYDLPSDIELSVVDAEAVWPEPEPTDADWKSHAERKLSVLQGIVAQLERGEIDGRFSSMCEYEKQWLGYARLAEIQIRKIEYSHLRETLRKRLEKLQERFDQISQLEPIENSQSSAGATEADPYNTGFPGRPTIKHHIEREFLRRANNGEALATLEAEASSLRDWAEKEHPNARTPTEKTIKNNIRHLYNRHVRNKAQN